MVSALEGRLLQALCNRLSSVLDTERVDAHAARQHAAAPCLRQYLHFYTTNKASKLSTKGVDAHAARQHEHAAAPCLRQYLHFYTSKASKLRLMRMQHGSTRLLAANLEESLYFCTSKASNLKTKGVDAHAARGCAVSASVFVLLYHQ
jgi:hypothetical protein